MPVKRLQSAVPRRSIFSYSILKIYHYSWNPLKHSGCRAILHFLRKYSVVFRYVGIQEGQVAFVLGFLFGVAKFEMPCFHRDLHRNGRLASTISCFYAQSYTWLCFDPNNQLSPFLRCIF